MSRSATPSAGDLELICPTSASELHGPIHHQARLSWWPASAAFAWLAGGDSYQKLSERPREGTCEWMTIAYDESACGADIRAMYRHRRKRIVAAEESTICNDPLYPRGACGNSDRRLPDAVRELGRTASTKEEVPHTEGESGSEDRHSANQPLGD